MTLTPTDVFAIQGAIDAYEKRFPRRPSPSAVEALVWQAGGRARQLPSGLVLHDVLQDAALLGTRAGTVAFKIQLRVVRSIETGLGRGKISGLIGLVKVGRIPVEPNYHFESCYGARLHVLLECHKIGLSRRLKTERQ
jgi:hypothetical protein